MILPALLLASCALAAEGGPKLTLAQAGARAQAAVGGQAVERAELTREGERLVWDVDVRVSSAQVKEVWLDAQTGAISRVETAGSSAQVDAYVRNARDQLDELERRIEQLRRSAGQGSEQARREAQRRAGELEAQARDAQKRLDELQASGQARWLRLKSGVERALLDLRQAYDEAASSQTARGSRAR